MQDVLRNERKFLISETERIQKCAKLRQILATDGHSGEDGYMVRSLYFDTEYDGDFFDKEHGLDVRRKIRLRTYDADADFALLELKQKQGVQQRKRSLKLSREDAKALASGRYEVLLKYKDPFAAECYGLMCTRVYRPRIIVEYRRMAFIAKENRIRVTFDSKLCACQSNLDIFSKRLPLVPIIPPDGAVLEVKFDGFLLTYIRQLLNSFERSELSVSKYCLARHLTYSKSL